MPKTFPKVYPVDVFIKNGKRIYMFDDPKIAEQFATAVRDNLGLTTSYIPVGHRVFDNATDPFSYVNELATSEMTGIVPVKNP